MNNTFATIIAVTGIALAVPALADDNAQTQDKVKVERGSDGSYHQKGTSATEGTDANGTYTSTEKKTNVDIDSKGNLEKKIETETVTDPSGLFNKTKQVTTDKEKRKNGKLETEHETKVNGTVVEKTTHMDDNR